MTEINALDLKFYQDLLVKSSGLHLSDDKAYLLETRLIPVGLSLGYKTLSDFTKDLRVGADPSLSRAVIEAMTTNETSFFRDAKPFDALQEYLRELVEGAARSGTIRILSAACSSGQEACSIAMTMEEFFQDKSGWDYEIIGTDISVDVLEKARKGEYCQFEIQRGLSIQRMVAYFEQDGNVWRVKDQLKRKMKFQSMNLLHDLSALGDFDIIFCRNVMIYFNSETKTKVLEKLARRLKPSGLLFLGASEAVIGLDVPFISNPLCSGALSLKEAGLDPKSTVAV